MGYISDKLKEILKKIRASKRLMYLVSVSVLVLFCFALNVAFSFLTNDFTSKGANILINDLEYKMVINEVELNENVGTNAQSNTIIGDRIIHSKTSKYEMFDIVLTSLNDISSKYEIIYKVCTDVTCTSFIDEPDDLIISYKIGSQDLINGYILENETKKITIVTRNSSDKDYYVQIGLNVGYSHNELKLTNQINTVYDMSVNGNLNIVSYVDGKETASFPVEPNYETSVKCTYSDGTTASARGVLTYNNGWKLNVYNIDETATTCTLDFEEVLYVTYDVLLSRYKCANQNTDVSASDAILIYSGNCSTLKSDDGGWRLSFLSNGTLTVSGLIYIDAFLVGGGGGGRGYGGSAVSKGGAGGNTYVKSQIRLSNQGDTYSVTLGAGGTYGNTGGTTSLVIGSNTYQATGGAPSASSSATGVCEFLETASSGCKYTDNGYNGYYAGGGGAGLGGTGDGCGNAGNGGPGGGGAGAHCYSTICYGHATAGAANTGGGGGGGTWCNNDYGEINMNGASGGSGVVVIRNTRS